MIKHDEVHIRRIIEAARVAVSFVRNGVLPRATSVLFGVMLYGVLI